MIIPFEHQLEGVKFLKEKRKCILADEMGLGKTIQAIISAKDLTNGGVVICPASLKTNWAREILLVDEEANIEVADGGNIYNYIQGAGLLSSKWLIVNYDILNNDKVKAEIYKYMPTTLILDESHYIKNLATIRTKATLEICEIATNVFLLTGTPIMNRPMELYSQLKAVSHPLATGKASWFSFAKKYCGGFHREFWKIKKDKAGNIIRNEFGEPIKQKYRFFDTSGATNLDLLSENIKNVYLRRTKDILGDKLPAKIITNIEVEISKDLRKRYESSWDDYIEYIKNVPKGEERDLANIQMAKHIIQLNKLKQVASVGKIPHIVESVKEMIEQEEKVIIFTQYKHTLETIKEELKKVKIKSVTLSGSDNSKKRQEAIDKFQKEKVVSVFIGNIKASGVGITLTEATKVIFADMEWTPALHNQAEDRAHRIGQTSLVNVYYYIAKDTVDEDIIELLEKKQQIIKNILDGENMAKTKDITKDAINKMIEKASFPHN